MLAISSRTAFLAGFSLVSLWAADALAWRGGRCYYYYPYGYYVQPAPVAGAAPQPQQVPAMVAPAPQASAATPYATYYRAPAQSAPAAPSTTYYAPPSNGYSGYGYSGYGYYGRELGQVWGSGSQSGVSEPVTDQPTAPLSYPR
jgi:hypothetical protein